MKLLEWLSGPDHVLIVPALVAALAIAVQAGALSALVVLKRLAFIGQGVSHAAFGGVGLAAVLGLTTGGGLTSLGYFGFIGLFCIATALGIAWVSDRRGLREDTVIGIFLVASMAMGFLLLHLHARRNPGDRQPSVETWLFGSLLEVGRPDAIAACIVGAGLLGALWVLRRPMLFWAFDEQAARASGVRVGLMRSALMAMLAVSIVVSMKLAGAVLATALPVLPGAIALRLSSRMGPVMAISMGSALVGVLAGFIVSFETDWPTGSCLVGVLVVMFALTWPLRWLMRKASPTS